MGYVFLEVYTILLACLTQCEEHTRFLNPILTSEGYGILSVYSKRPDGTFGGQVVYIVVTVFTIAYQVFSTVYHIFQSVVGHLAKVPPFTVKIFTCLCEETL